jgi:hypothetical protein
VNNMEIRQDIKKTVLASLRARINKYKKGIVNIDNQKRAIKEWQAEIDNKQKYTTSGMIQMAVYEDTNLALIKQAQEWLDKAEPIVKECEEAIEYIERNW